jgi:heme exporter protein D
MAKNYIESVAVDRKALSSITSLLIPLFLFLFSWLCYYSALEPLPEASEAYLSAARATRYARMGWSLFFAMIGLWFVATRVRQFFAIPAATRAGGKVFTIARNLLVAVLLYILISDLGAPIASPYGYSDDRLVMGAAAGLVWLTFAVDLIPLVFRAVLALKARASALAFRRSKVGGSESGAVRIEGTIALAERGIDKSDDVYRHQEEEGQSIIDLVPFVLESDGQRLFVDIISDKTVVVPKFSPYESSGYRRLKVGDKVEVWGEVKRPEDAYRGQPSRMSPGEGRMYVFQGDRKLNRRLVQAAGIELLASASFLTAGVFFLFFIFDLYLVML